MTCGGSIGNAGRYLKALCGKKGMNYLGCYGIVMPENYIAMFSTPAREEAFRTIEKAEGEIDRAIGLIKNSKAFSEPQITLGDKMNSGIVNSIFYPLFVHAKKFYATDACIACGKCERSVRPRISALKTASLYGGKTVRTAWLVSAAAPKRRLSMVSTAKDFRDILVPNSFFTVHLFPFRAILYGNRCIEKGAEKRWSPDVQIGENWITPHWHFRQ